MSRKRPILVSDSDENQDSDGDEKNLPSRDECEARCQMFASVTGTDTALAMFYLQDREWSVERALNDYYADFGVKEAESAHAPTGVSSTATATEKSETGTVLKKIGDDRPYLTSHPPLLQPKNENRIRILSWNIDGLDPDNLQSRTEGMCSVLLQEAPEIIFLQEVVERSLRIIQAKCNGYQVFPSAGPGHSPDAYFTAMLLRKDCVREISISVADFPTSVMSRCLLEAKCEVKDIPMTLMTSHLESTIDHRAERKRQLKVCFDRMTEIFKEQTVIFGGDLNLRDKELTGQSAKPPEVFDLWECSGKRKEAQYTWDLTINDNKQMALKFQPRCRFDRLYIRQAAVAKLRPVYFELVGIQRLASCRRFPSDHWGILGHLDIL